MSTPKQHAKFAASSSKRWVNCPASLKLSEDAPPQESSAAADKGTLAHQLMEWAVISRSQDVVNDFDENKFPLEMREQVQVFVDHVYEIFDSLPGAELIVETKIHLPFLHPTEAFGTVDVAIIEPFGVLHVIDYKDGFDYVPSKDNEQMIYYALGIAHKYGFDFEKVCTSIYQPNRPIKGQSFRTDTFDVEKLKSWEKIFKDAIKACDSADVDFDLRAGDWCKWCPAKIICPEITRASMSQAELDFSTPVQPDPKHLTSSQLKTILDRSAYLELWLNEVKTYAENMIRAGVKIPGWGVVPTRAKRIWAKPDSFFEYKTHNIKLYDKVKNYGAKFLKTEPKSVAEVEKDLRALKVPKDIIENFMKENVIAVSSGDKLSQTNNDYDANWLDDNSIY